MVAVTCFFCKRRIRDEETKFTRLNLATLKKQIPEEMHMGDKICSDCMYSDEREDEKPFKEPEKIKRRSLFGFGK